MPRALPPVATYDAVPCQRLPRWNRARIVMGVGCVENSAPRVTEAAMLHNVVVKTFAFDLPRLALPRLGVIASEERTK